MLILITVFVARRNNSFSSGNCHRIRVRWTDGQLIGTHGWAVEWAYPQPPRHPPKPGGRKVPFTISANLIEIDEDVNRAHLRTHWLAIRSDALNNCTAFCQRVKWMNADRAQYVRSSSGLVIILVMTLLIYSVDRTIGDRRTLLSLCLQGTARNIFAIILWNVLFTMSSE